MHTLCELDLGPARYRLWLQRAYWLLAAVVTLAILSI
jgi:hypothetical protein